METLVESAWRSSLHISLGHEVSVSLRGHNHCARGPADCSQMLCGQFERMTQVSSQTNSEQC